VVVGVSASGGLRSKYSEGMQFHVLWLESASPLDIIDVSTIAAGFGPRICAKLLPQAGETGQLRQLRASVLICSAPHLGIA